MKCPHCKEDLRTPPPAEYNADASQKRVTTVTLCCGYGVILIPLRSMRVEPYNGSSIEDDWGHLMKGTTQ